MFEFKREIAIDHTKIDAPLNDYPVMVKLDSSNFDFSKLESDEGYDIQFVDNTDNLLDWEIELFDNTTQEAVFHIRIPNVSDTQDTKITMNYGNPDVITDQSNPTAVWDDNFVMVQHMGESLVDSTGNGNDGTNYGSNVVDGLNGDAREFYGTSRITFPNSAIQPGGLITIDLIAKINTDNSNTIFEANRNDGINRVLGSHLPHIGTDVYWDAGPGGPIVYDRITKAINNEEYNTVNLWSYRKDVPLETMCIKRNGVTWHSGTGLTKDVGTPTEGFVVGANVNGRIHEFRVSNIARSDAWIKADDYNLRQNTLQVVSEELPNIYIPKTPKDTSELEITVYDKDFNGPLRILDEFESFIWTDRYNGYGDFELYTMVDESLLEDVREGYYLKSNTSNHIMVVENRRIETNTLEGDKLLITGRSLESILDRRIIWEQTILDGFLQDVLSSLLDDNVINPTDANRKIENFVFYPSEDSYITSLTITDQLRGEELYDYIEKTCKANGVGFGVIRDNGFLVFYLYSGKDLSYEQSENSRVIFSQEFDNLVSSNYKESVTGYKTTALVLGEGEGSDKKVTTANKTTDVGLDRREIAVNATGVSQTVDGATIPEAEYLTQLEKQGDKKLSEKEKLEEFDAEVMHGDMYTYGEDYELGDIIHIVNEYGLKGKFRVTEFIRCKDKEGYKAYPTFSKV